MTILRHELKQGRRMAIIWAVGCALIEVLSLSVFPKVKNGMTLINQMLKSMGTLAKAFAADRLDYGTVMGYYAAEAGNILSLGGGLFAAILGISMLSKEEGRHTAEYLFPHPVSRLWVLVQKLMAMLLLFLTFSAITATASWLTLRWLGEPFSMVDFVQIHMGVYLLMLHLGCLCLCISAFMSRDSTGLGIGLSLGMYFMLLLINMEVGIDALRYLTPYYYTEAAKLVGPDSFHSFFLKLNLGLSAAFLMIGFSRYATKDLRI